MNADTIRSVKKGFNFVLKCIIPYNVVVLKYQLMAKKQQAIRQERIDNVKAQPQTKPRTDFSYQEAIRFLSTTLNREPEQVQEGCIAETSLEYCTEFLVQRAHGKPMVGLHVGNFVGLSLAYLTDAILRIHPASVMISIDPNIPHRGIENPLSIVTALLTHFGLQEHNLILTGYTLEKSVSNDGYIFNDYDPVSRFQEEQSCEQQLERLACLMPGGFDFCMIDGNHEENYLRREVELMAGLLKADGLMFLDDVTPQWEGVANVFHHFDHEHYEKLGTDWRVGVIRKKG